jgi:hypothetical protein
MKAIICETGGRAATGSAEAVPRCLSHLGKIRGCLPQYLIGLPELTVRALKLFDPRNLRAGRSWPFATVALDPGGPKCEGCPANNPICLRSPSAPQLRSDIHRGVPSAAEPHARGTQVNTDSMSSSFVSVP